MVDFITGRWQVESVLFAGVPRSEWNEFQLSINKTSDTTGVFYAYNIPYYDYLEADEIDKYWPDTSYWYTDALKEIQYLVRNDGLEIEVDTAGVNLLSHLYVVHSPLRNQMTCACDTLDGEVVCPLCFEGDWEMILGRIN